MSWTFEQEYNTSGFGIFAIHAWNTSHTHTDLTFFRGVPTQIQSLSFADPFGDSTASLTFPQCTGFDSASGDTWWLKENVNIDITWVPATTVPIAGATPIIDPRTNKLGLYLHTENAVTVWEGFTATVEPSLTGVSIQCQGALYQVDRYYAKPLFPRRPKPVEEMIKRYFDPDRRGIYSQALNIDWDGKYSGVAWNRTYTQTEYDNYYKQDKALRRYLPTWLDVGDNWTGVTTRHSGSWEKALTGYIQSQLAIMYVTHEQEGFVEGDQWTMTKGPGRTPVLYVRRQNKAPDYVAWYGQPGVDVNLNKDGTQINNVIFGRGTGFDGSAWLVQNFPIKAPWSAWAPIAWDHPAAGNEYGLYHWDDPVWSLPDPDYPNSRYTTKREILYDGYDADWERANDYWVQEKSWNNIPSGIDQAEAEQIGQQYIARDKNPGWSGTIRLSVDLYNTADPAVAKSKWLIRDGHVLYLKGWQGVFTPTAGVNIFHISQVTLSPQDNSVELTVDTKFRDLLSTEEAMLHSRDSLAPVKMLQVGKMSALVEDLAQSWNTNKGAGYFPTTAVKMKREFTFPYAGDTNSVANKPDSQFKAKYKYPNQIADISDLVTDNETLENSLQAGETAFYVPVNCGNPNATYRWAAAQVLLSQAGTLSRTEFACYDEDGNLAEVEFHVSMYKSIAIDIKGMPKPLTNTPNGAGGTFSKKQYAALWSGAFDRIDPATGLQWEAGPTLNYQYHLPVASFGFMQGWGTFDRPAGYSPGSKDLGAKMTGMLVDGAPISYNMMDNPEFLSAQANKEESKHVLSTSYSISVAIYAQNLNGAVGTNRASKPYKWVYVMGRFYRQVQTGQ